jgi:hypothetical protein
MHGSFAILKGFGNRLTGEFCDSFLLFYLFTSLLGRFVQPHPALDPASPQNEVLKSGGRSP